MVCKVQINIRWRFLSLYAELLTDPSSDVSLTLVFPMMHQNCVSNNQQIIEKKFHISDNSNSNPNS